ncbi:hypothetical protein C0389_09620 [bacterium]|nr:hypothetical protein [bacterium]
MKIKKSTSLFAILPVCLLLLGSIVFSGCEASRTGPELARPNPPAPVAQPIILSAYVRDISDQSAIAGATVKIAKGDQTIVTTVLTDNSGKYSYDVTNITDAALLVSANKDGYGFSNKVAEIKKTLNIAVVDDILLTKLVVVSAPVTPAAGGTATTTNTQTVSSTPLTVTVPPNAVPANITLTVATIPASQVPSAPIAGNAIQSVGQFGPSGTVFIVPVTVTFPLPNRQAVGKTFTLYKLNETTNVWANTGIIATVNASGTAATAQLSSFSTYAPIDPLTIIVPTTGTTTTENLGSFSLASGSTTKSYTETNNITISVTGTVSSDWLLGEVKKQTGNINIGSFTQNIPFSVPGLPAEYIKNGVQYNPGSPNEAGNWVYEWVVTRSTTTRNWTATGGVAPNNFSGSGAITEQKVDVTSASWKWVAHNQGSVGG